MGNVKVIADSIAPNGKRITTITARLWRLLLAEANTHREQSKSVESSRARPLEKTLERVRRDPFVPRYWGRNQKGMRAGQELTQAERDRAAEHWLNVRDAAVIGAVAMGDLGMHKNVPNRLLEPWMTVERIITATEWENMLALRTEVGEDGVPMAEPHYRDEAEEILAALNESEPQSLREWEWHLPYIQPEERPRSAEEWDNRVEDLLAMSAARSGRVSFSKHGGGRSTLEEDRERSGAFRKDGHMGPLEHQAKPAPTADFRSGNFVGWVQWRKMLPGERRSCPRLLKKVWRKP